MKAVVLSGARAQGVAFPFGAAEAAFLRGGAADSVRGDQVQEHCRIGDPGRAVGSGQVPGRRRGGGHDRAVLPVPEGALAEAGLHEPGAGPGSQIARAEEAGAGQLHLHVELFPQDGGSVARCARVVGIERELGRGGDGRDRGGQRADGESDADLIADRQLDPRREPDSELCRRRVGGGFSAGGDRGLRSAPDLRPSLHRQRPEVAFQQAPGDLPVRLMFGRRHPLQGAAHERRRQRP